MDNRTIEQVRHNEKKLIKEIEVLETQLKKQKEIIDKAVKELKQGISFCQNDSQGIYDKCNIAIRREQSILSILEDKEV